MKAMFSALVRLLSTFSVASAFAVLAFTSHTPQLSMPWPSPPSAGAGIGAMPMLVPVSFAASTMEASAESACQRMASFPVNSGSSVVARAPRESMKRFTLS